MGALQAGVDLGGALETGAKSGKSAQRGLGSARPKRRAAVSALLLVGGATRMPAFRRFVRNMTGLEPAGEGVDPDQVGAVAQPRVFTSTLLLIMRTRRQMQSLKDLNLQKGRGVLQTNCGGRISVALLCMQMSAKDCFPIQPLFRRQALTCSCEEDAFTVSRKVRGLLGGYKSQAGVDTHVYGRRWRWERPCRRASWRAACQGTWSWTSGR